jgi:hypothetical protein
LDVVRKQSDRVLPTMREHGNSEEIMIKNPARILPVRVTTCGTPGEAWYRPETGGMSTASLDYY